MPLNNNSPSFSPPLLGPLDPPAFEVYNPTGTAPLLIVSDHASRRVPGQLGDLGLDPVHFEKHIAYDIGADAITRCLADRLNARAMLAGYSRLVLDLNRAPGELEQMPAISDQTPIPANAHISEEEAAARTAALYTPYHDAIEEQVALLWQLHQKPPALFSIHSFTPSMNGQDRFWDIGVLWNKDPRMAKVLIENLNAWEGLHIGDNEPYSAEEVAHTLDIHATDKGIANAAIEIRQDHCATAVEASHWADILTDAMHHILALDDLHQIKHY